MGGWATALRGAGEVSPTRGHLSGDKGLETRRQGAAGDKGLSQVGVWAAGGHVAGGEARALVLRATEQGRGEAAGRGRWGCGSERWAPHGPRRLSRLGRGRRVGGGRWF